MSLSFFVPALAVILGWFKIDFWQLLPIVAIPLIFLLCGLRISFLRHPKAARVLYVSGYYYLSAIGSALTCAVLTASNFSLVDGMLSAADKKLGFDWLWIHEFFRTSFFTSRLLISAYSALNWMPQVLIVCLCMGRDEQIVFRFLTAWILSLLITALLYPFFPAIAAFRFYGLTPDMMPGPTAMASWQLPEIMDGLRSGAHRTLGRADLIGVVTMPSFHAAGATILLWGFWTFKFIRPISTPIAILMFFSAVPVGGHYVVDVFAGLAVAIMSIVVSGRLMAMCNTKAAIYGRTQMRPLVSIARSWVRPPKEIVRSTICPPSQPDHAVGQRHAGGAVGDDQHGAVGKDAGAGFDEAFLALGVVH